MRWGGVGDRVVILDWDEWKALIKIAEAALELLRAKEGKSADEDECAET